MELFVKIWFFVILSLVTQASFGITLFEPIRSASKQHDTNVENAELHAQITNAKNIVANNACPAFEDDSYDLYDLKLEFQNSLTDNYNTLSKEDRVVLNRAIAIIYNCDQDRQ